MSDREPTQPKSCEGCELFGVGKGFVADSGNFATAKYLLCFEAPGSQEVVFQLRPVVGRGFFETQKECDEEIARRQKALPEVPVSFLRQGAPIVGPTGYITQSWILNRVGIKREECAIMNVLRCLPPRSKTGDPYPTGETRKSAEQFCRKYDRVGEFNPDTIVTTLHPSSLAREVTPLPLVIKDMEKVRDFTAQGRRVMTLLGGKAAHAFLGYAQNVTRWRGDYTSLDLNWYSNVVTRLTDALRRPKKAKKKTKKLLSEELREDQSSSTGVPSESSIDIPPKKKRKRKTSKIQVASSDSGKKMEQEISENSVASSESVHAKDKTGSV